jgi:hypothetical protein
MGFGIQQGAYVVYFGTLISHLLACARYPFSALLWAPPIFVMNNGIECKGTVLPQKTKIYLSKKSQKGLRMRLNGLRSARDVARRRLTSGEADT